jgi:hypothetical protein
VQVRKERVDICRGKAGIFEREQDTDVQNDGQQNDPALHGLLPLAHGLALGLFRLREQELCLRLYFVQPQSEVVHRKRRQQQVYEQFAADQPEKSTVGGEQEVFFSAPRHETVHHETKRQEHDEKCRREKGGQRAPFSREQQRRKLHISSPPVRVRTLRRPVSQACGRRKERLQILRHRFPDGVRGTAVRPGERLPPAEPPRCMYAVRLLMVLCLPFALFS